MRLGPGRLDLLHHHQGGEQVADLVGQVRVGGRVLGQRRPLAPAEPGHELLGELLDRVPLGDARRSWLRPPAGGPGSSAPPARIALSRRRARTNRWLAAASPMPEHLGRLGVAELLEVPQGEHLPVDRVHPVEGLLDADLEFGLHGRLAGAGVPAEELLGERHGAGLRQRPAVERHLPAGVPGVGAEVVAVERPGACGR